MLECDDAGSVAVSGGVSRAAFAVKVEGDGFYPAIRNGTFLICDPTAACVPGELVLIETLDGRRQVRELVFERAEEITTLNVNGAHRQTLAKVDIKSMVAIIGTTAASQWHE